MAYNFCFSGKVKHKKGWKKKVRERSFVLYQHSSIIGYSTKNYRKLEKFFAYQIFIFQKYNYDNIQKLQPVGFPKNERG